MRVRLSVLAPCLMVCALTTLAQANPLPALSDDALEARFWACDVASTHTVLSAAEGAQCVRWQDELKQRRFGGDFARLLDWWRAHKAEQHARHLSPQLNAARR